MKKLSILCLAVCAMAACKNDTGGATTNTTETPKVEKVADGLYCFELEEGSALTLIELTVKGNEVTGTQAYTTGQDTDGSAGTIKGTISGKDIKGTYTYVVEGSEGTDNVSFTLDGKSLIEHGGQQDIVYKEGPCESTMGQ